jgi:hypothetical protein
MSGLMVCDEAVCSVTGLIEAVIGFDYATPVEHFNAFMSVGCAVSDT